MLHDSDYVVILADNSEAFIFYRMLMTFCKIDDACGDETFKRELQRVLTTHKKYLKDEYVDVLDYVKQTGFTKLGEEFYCGI